MQLAARGQHSWQLLSSSKIQLSYKAEDSFGPSALQLNVQRSLGQTHHLDINVHMSSRPLKQFSCPEVHVS